VVHSVLAVCAIRATWTGWAFQRNLILRNVSGGRGINISGVDFWHAVEFSRNGRFLCALSVLINSVPGSPGASLRSCVSDSIRSLRARFSPVRFRLLASSRFQPYQIRFRLWRPAGAGSTVRLSLFGLSDSNRSGFRFVSGSDFRRRSASEQLFAAAFRRVTTLAAFPGDS
jgi:hypothetical protein